MIDTWKIKCLCSQKVSRLSQLARWIPGTISWNMCKSEIDYEIFIENFFSFFLGHFWFIPVNKSNLCSFAKLFLFRYYLWRWTLVHLWQSQFTPYAQSFVRWKMQKRDNYKTTWSTCNIHQFNIFHWKTIQSSPTEKNNKFKENTFS